MSLSMQTEHLEELRVEDVTIRLYQLLKEPVHVKVQAFICTCVKF
jgi:hypothetical protein